MEENQAGQDIQLKLLPEINLNIDVPIEDQFNLTTAQPETQSKHNSFFDIRTRTLPNFTFHSLKQGLPTSFCYGDFFICALVCRLFLGA